MQNEMDPESAALLERYKKHIKLLAETAQSINDESKGEIGVFIIVNLGKDYIATGNECPMCALNITAQMNIAKGMQHNHVDEKPHNNIVPVLVSQSEVQDLINTLGLQAEDFESTEKLDKKKVN